MIHSVTVFTSYPFEKGQKIHITDSRRRGDWEVMDVDDAKVTLRCPVSGKQLKWDRFCYFVEQADKKWPDE